MKKIIVLLFVLLMVIGALTACGGEKADQNAAQGDRLQQIKDRGTIIVAMEGTWSPWTYHDENDVLTGFDVEVATAIADKMGVKVEFVEGEWDGLLAGLAAGRYDLMVNGVNVTDERKESYDFSDPYAFDRTAVITMGDDDRIQSMEDLKGMRTANTISSTYAQIAEENGAEVTGVDDLNPTFELLLSGRIDATLNAEMTYNDYMKAHPDANLKIAVLVPQSSEIAIPMPKGEQTDSLRAEVNRALAELHAEGKLTELSMKYFGIDITSNS